MPLRLICNILIVQALRHSSLFFFACLHVATTMASKLLSRLRNLGTNAEHVRADRLPTAAFWTCQQLMTPSSSLPRPAIPATRAQRLVQYETSQSRTHPSCEQPNSPRLHPLLGSPSTHITHETTRRAVYEPCIIPLWSAHNGTRWPDIDKHTSAYRRCGRRLPCNPLVHEQALEPRTTILTAQHDRYQQD